MHRNFVESTRSLPLVVFALITRILLCCLPVLAIVMVGNDWSGRRLFSLLLVRIGRMGSPSANLGVYSRVAAEQYLEVRSLLG